MAVSFPTRAISRSCVQQWLNNEAKALIVECVGRDPATIVWAYYYCEPWFANLRAEIRFLVEILPSVIAYTLRH